MPPVPPPWAPQNPSGKVDPRTLHPLYVTESAWLQDDPILLRDRNYIGLFDDHIDFDEASHTYFLDGETLNGSSTGFIHSFFGHFDADQVIKKMRKGRNWNRKNKYFGMTNTQIKKMWEDNRVSASRAGTRMHELIEWFYNDSVTEHQLRYMAHAFQMPELLQFLRFHHEIVLAKQWEPFRTELRAFSRRHGLAGSVDMIFRDAKDGRLIIVDWKRSKEIRRENRWQKGNGPLQHMDDCNFSHYSLQLNLYKWMVECFTDYKVKALYLGVFHPNQGNEYQLLATPTLKYEISQMLQHRLDDSRDAGAKLIANAYETMQCVVSEHSGDSRTSSVAEQVIALMETVVDKSHCSPKKSTGSRKKAIVCRRMCVTELRNNDLYLFGVF